MTRTLIVVVALACAPWLLALVRQRPAALLTAAGCLALVPLAIPHEQPILRFTALIFAWVMLLKIVQYLRRHETPARYIDFVQFLTVLAVADWNLPRRPDHRRASMTIGVGLLQLVLFAGIFLALRSLTPGAIVVVVATQILLYLALAGASNLAVSQLHLRGVAHRAPFRSPLLSRSPSEFWGRRWNSWASHLFYRFAFVPAGGSRRPALGTLAAFGMSGLLHEALVGAASLRVTGWMVAYFTLQAVAVIVTSKLAPFRRLQRRSPRLAWVVTMIFMFASGSMFVAGMQPVLG